MGSLVHIQPAILQDTHDTINLISGYLEYLKGGMAPYLEQASASLVVVSAPFSLSLKIAPTLIDKLKFYYHDDIRPIMPWMFALCCCSFCCS